MVQLVTGVWCIGAVTLLIVLPSGAQRGMDCDSNRSCMPHQTCYEGYCKCDRGYIKGQRYCWEVRNFGKTCFFDVQCVDHRMICEVNETESIVKRCRCNRFHSWNEDFKQCTPIMNISALLATLHEEQDITNLNSKSEHEMFIRISIVGLIAVTSVCIFILSCIAYGCCSCTRAKDLNTDESTGSCPQTCPLHKVPLPQQDQPPPREGKKKWKTSDCSIPIPLHDINIC